MNRVLSRWVGLIIVLSQVSYALAAAESPKKVHKKVEASDSGDKKKESSPQDKTSGEIVLSDSDPSDPDSNNEDSKKTSPDDAETEKRKAEGKKIRENVLKGLGLSEKQYQESVQKLADAKSDTEKKKVANELLDQMSPFILSLIAAGLDEWVNDLPEDAKDILIAQAQERQKAQEEKWIDEEKKKHAKEKTDPSYRGGASTRPPVREGPPPSHAPKTAQELADIDVTKYSMEELYNTFRVWARKLDSLGGRGEKFDLSEDYVPGKSEMRDVFHGLAKIYTTLHMDQRTHHLRDRVKYPMLLGTMTETLRKMNPQSDPGKSYTERGNSDLERMWEWELSVAMNQPAAKLKTNDIIRESLLNSDKFLYMYKGRRGDLPNIAHADQIGGSWTFAYRALQAMAFVDGISVLRKSSDPKDMEALPQLEAKAKEVIDLWLSDRFAHNADARMAQRSNQVVHWGEGYSLNALRRLTDEKGLRDLLPVGYRSDGELEKIQRGLQKTLTSTLDRALGNPGSERGAGGSNVHTAMFFANASTLPPGALAMRATELMRRRGATDDLVPYAPLRQLPINETVRSAAGRAVTVHTANFLNDETPDNKRKLLASLENFGIYSGSLRAEVPRSGVHSGDDGLAPYYFHPELQVAMRGLAALSRSDNTGMSEKFRQRLDRINGHMRLVAKSTFDPTTKTMLSPGDQTYQQGGNTFAWSLAISSLAETKGFKKPAKMPESSEEFKRHPDIGKGNPPIVASAEGYGPSGGGRFRGRGIPRGPGGPGIPRGPGGGVTPPIPLGQFGAPGRTAPPGGGGGRGPASLSPPGGGGGGTGAARRRTGQSGGEKRGPAGVYDEQGAGDGSDSATAVGEKEGDSSENDSDAAKAEMPEFEKENSFAQLLKGSDLAKSSESFQETLQEVLGEDDEGANLDPNLLGGNNSKTAEDQKKDLAKGQLEFLKMLNLPSVPAPDQEQGQLKQRVQVRVPPKKGPSMREKLLRRKKSTSRRSSFRWQRGEFSPR